jgi:peptidoglycan/LPS O-acetylase OafA/YrhL
MRKMQRIHQLDLARGIAAIGIVIFHVYSGNSKLLEPLFFFVDFFFVLSGFVLYKSLYRITEASLLRKFVIQRAARLFPMAWAGVMFVISIQLAVDLRNFLLNQVSPSRIDISFTTVIFNLFLLQIFSLNAQLLLFPLWSLSAEWITNLVYGVLRLSKMFNVWVLVLCGFVFVVMGQVDLLPINATRILEPLGRCMYGFGVGLIWQKIIERHRPFKSCSRGMYLLVLVILLTLYGSYFLLGMWFLIVIPWGFGLMISLLARLELIPRGGLSKISTFLGRHSYGIYVWHIPMINSWSLILKYLSPSSSLLNSNTLQLSVVLLLSFIASFLVISLFESPTREYVKRYV